jgi:hypothetical protein
MIIRRLTLRGGWRRGWWRDLWRRRRRRRRGTKERVRVTFAFVAFDIALESDCAASV